MFERTFGHYARVLVDMDLTQTLRYKVLVERQGFAFYVDLDYENLPEFCTHCNMVGHSLENCKKAYAIVEEPQTKGNTNKPKQRVEGQKNYVQSKDNRPGHKEVINVEDSSPIDKEQPDVAVKGKAPVEVQQDLVIQPEGTSGASKEIVVEQHNSFAALEDTTVIEQHIEDTELIQEQIQSPIDAEKEISTQHSEFVDATQFINDEELVVEVEKSTPPVISKRAENDMQFLNESWANMDEAKDDDNRLITEMDKASQQVADPVVPIPPVLKTSLAASGKKINAKKSQSSKSLYETRSKVGLSKPSL
ncbi:ABC transporter B family member [Trifolium medium]|uniref:ABC transporter B family member n=1 Tax=Trifolium medium TaxID=97028 RepID=A0A392N5R0_9FABA|nr:ABC transporter B family member [Trifolium medium]